MLWYIENHMTYSGFQSLLENRQWDFKFCFIAWRQFVSDSNVDNLGSGKYVIRNAHSLHPPNFQAQFSCSDPFIKWIHFQNVNVHVKRPIQFNSVRSLDKQTCASNMTSIGTNDVVAFQNMLKLAQLIWKSNLEICHCIFLKGFDAWLQPLGMGMLLFTSSTPIQKTREGRAYHHLELAKYLKGGLCSLWKHN